MHDGVAGIAGGEQDLEVAAAAARFVGELPAVHAAGQADIGEQQLDFRVCSQHRQRRAAGAASSVR